MRMMIVRTTRAVRRAVCLVVSLLSIFLCPDGLAAPLSFPTNTTTVKLDGVPLGTAHPSGFNSLRNTIVFNADDSRFHMWTFRGSSASDLSGLGISALVHAVSTDGINFTATGNLVPPSNWWTTLSGGASGPLAVAPTQEPIFAFPRAQRVGSEWWLLAWSPNQTGAGDYNYNTVVWNLGANIANLSPTLLGPLPTLATGSTPPRNTTGMGANHPGAWGLIGGNLYLVQDSATGGLGRYAFTSATPPNTTAAPGLNEANLYAGTPYCWFLAEATTPGSCGSLTQAYVHNYGRVVSVGSTLGAYYSFRAYPSGARLDKNLWYVESTDGGATWLPPAAVYGATSGNSVLVDGFPNQGNFSLPEVAVTATGARGYFSTTDACGNTVQVTEAPTTSLVGPTITKSFAQRSLAVGGSTTLTVTLAAPPVSCTPAPSTAPAYTQVGFTDLFPSGMVLSGTPLVSSSCSAAPFGGALSGLTAGATSFSLTGATLAAGSSCTVVVNVTVNSAGAKTNVINRISNYSNAQGINAVANATDVVSAAEAPPQPVPTLGDWARVSLAISLCCWGFAALRWRR